MGDSGTAVHQATDARPFTVPPWRQAMCGLCGDEFEATRSYPKTWPSAEDVRCDACAAYERGAADGARDALADASLDDLLAELRRRAER